MKSEEADNYKNNNNHNHNGNGINNSKTQAAAAAAAATEKKITLLIIRNCVMCLLSAIVTVRLSRQRGSLTLGAHQGNNNPK